VNPLYIPVLFFSDIFDDINPEARCLPLAIGEYLGFIFINTDPDDR
jgi:hypothetical protein